MSRLSIVSLLRACVLIKQWFNLCGLGLADLLEWFLLNETGSACMYGWLVVVAFLMLPVTPVVERMSVLSRLRTLLYVA